MDFYEYKQLIFATDKINELEYTYFNKSKRRLWFEFKVSNDLMIIPLQCTLGKQCLILCMKFKWWKFDCKMNQIMIFVMTFNYMTGRWTICLSD